MHIMGEGLADGEMVRTMAQWQESMGHFLGTGPGNTSFWLNQKCVCVYTFMQYAYNGEAVWKLGIRSNYGRL